MLIIKQFRSISLRSVVFSYLVLAITLKQQMNSRGQEVCIFFMLIWLV